MAIKIEMLRCFAAVAEHGTLAEAAGALGRTASAVSMTLAQLEEEIGSPLFEGQRKSRLTPLGRMILEETRTALAQFDQSVHAIEGMARADTGHVRLAVTPSVATAVMPPIVARFRAEQPHVHVEMRDMDSAAVVAALRADEADIGLASAGPAPDLERAPLFSDPFGLVCPADHPLAARESCAWADLADTAFIANGLCTLIPDEGLGPILAGAGLTVPNTTSLLALVRAGMGVTILPRLAAAGDGALAFVPLAGVATRREVHLLTRPHRNLAPAARAFAAAVRRARIAPDGGPWLQPA